MMINNAGDVIFTQVKTGLGERSCFDQFEQQSLVYNKVRYSAFFHGHDDLVIMESQCTMIMPNFCLSIPGSTMKDKDENPRYKFNTVKQLYFYCLLQHTMVVFLHLWVPANMFGFSFPSLMSHWLMSILSNSPSIPTTATNLVARNRTILVYCTFRSEWKNTFKWI